METWYLQQHDNKLKGEKKMYYTENELTSHLNRLSIS